MPAIVLEKKWQRYLTEFFRNFEKVYFACGKTTAGKPMWENPCGNPCGKTTVLESVFNKTTGIDSAESADSEINSIDLQLY